MKKLLATTAVFALFAAPVLAQNSDGTDSQQNATQSSNASGNESSMTTEQMVASQDRVRNTLEDAGMTNVMILDAAYIVQATTPDNETVIMMIDTSGRVMGAQSAPGQTSTGSGAEAQEDGSATDAGEADTEDTGDSSAQ